MVIDADGVAAASTSAGKAAVSDAYPSSGPYSDGVPAAAPSPHAARGVYYKVFRVQEIAIKFDYEPKRIAYARYGVLGVLAGLVPIRGSLLHMCTVTLRGVTGMDAIVALLRAAWLAHLQSTPAASALLSGVGPVAPLVQLGRSAARVVTEPIRLYPQIFQGLRRGVAYGVLSATAELCHLASSLSTATQSALEGAQTLLGRRRRARHRGVAQPRGLRHGLREAGRVVALGARRAYTDVAVSPRRRRAGDVRPPGRGGVLLRTIGAVPGAVLEPLIAVCEALSLALHGLRNSVDRDAAREQRRKYRTHEQCERS